MLFTPYKWFRKFLNAQTIAKSSFLLVAYICSALVRVAEKKFVGFPS